MMPVGGYHLLKLFRDEFRDEIILYNFNRLYQFKQKIVFIMKFVIYYRTRQFH